MIALLFSAASLAPAADPKAEKYARPDLLVRAADVKDEKFMVLDVRAKEKYAAGHIPRAVNVMVGPWAKAVNDGTAGAAYWKKELAAVGLSPKVPVLVYSDDLRDAARGWWLLKLAGVPDVRLLDGGWAAYTAAKGETSTEAVTPTPAEPFDWAPEPRLAVKADVLKNLTDKTAGVIDARSAAEVAGGKVPGAMTLEWTDLLDPETKTFKPAADLTKLFAERRIDLSMPCVTYCQGGGAGGGAGVRAGVDGGEGRPELSQELGRVRGGQGRAEGEVTAAVTSCGSSGAVRSWPSPRSAWGGAAVRRCGRNWRRRSSRRTRGRRRAR